MIFFFFILCHLLVIFVTRGHRWTLVVIRGHSWSSMVTYGHSYVVLDKIVKICFHLYFRINLHFYLQLPHALDKRLFLFHPCTKCTLRLAVSTAFRTWGEHFILCSDQHGRFFSGFAWCLLWVKSTLQLLSLTLNVWEIISVLAHTYLCMQFPHV